MTVSEWKMTKETSLVTEIPAKPTCKVRKTRDHWGKVRNLVSDGGSSDIRGRGFLLKLDFTKECTNGPRESSGVRQNFSQAKNLCY